MPTVTFICDRYEHPLPHLVKFTKNTGATVIIRGYAKIRFGVIEYFNKDDYYANKGRPIH